MGAYHPYHPYHDQLVGTLPHRDQPAPRGFIWGGDTTMDDPNQQDAFICYEDSFGGLHRIPRRGRAYRRFNRQLAFGTVRVLSASERLAFAQLAEIVASSRPTSPVKPHQPT